MSVCAGRKPKGGRVAITHKKGGGGGGAAHATCKEKGGGAGLVSSKGAACCGPPCNLYFFKKRFVMFVPQPGEGSHILSYLKKSRCPHLGISWGKS